MAARIKVGLIAGVISLAFTACLSSLFGICGPVVSLIAGALAGYFAAKQETPVSKSEGGKIGAISGAITGGMGFIGQFVGSILALTILPPLMASMGNNSFNAISSEPTYWISGFGTAFCIGLGGVLFSALAGFGTGYISTMDKPAEASM